MIECETNIRNWGNSFGVVIPKDKIANGGLRLNQKVKIVISPIRRLKAKDIFGKLKLKVSTAKLLKDIDKELDSKFFRQRK